MEKKPIQGENLANFGDFLGILVQKHLRGEVKKFFLLRLSTRLVHEKLNFGIFEFYDFAEKNWKKIRFKFWNFGNFSSKTPTRRGLFVKKKLLWISLLKVFYKGFIRDFLVNFTREFLIKNFYEGFPCKMNREKIKGVSFAGKSL